MQEEECRIISHLRSSCDCEMIIFANLRLASQTASQPASQPAAASQQERQAAGVALAGSAAASFELPEGQEEYQAQLVAY